MSRKVISIKYVGEEADILTAIDALAHFGQFNSEGALTKEQVAQQYLTDFIRQRVKAYVQITATEADRNALQAKELATVAATEAALNAITKLPIEIIDAPIE